MTPATVSGIPLNRGRAEEILPLKPDLVLAGTFTAPATKALLRRLGIPVLELPVEQDFDGIRTNIRRVAKAIGEIARGEKLVAALDRSLAVKAPPDRWRPELMLYRFGGYSQGRDTLSNAIIERAGFANYAAARLNGVGRLSLERIVADPPDAILLGSRGTERDSLSAETLDHPALRQTPARAADRGDPRPALDLWSRQCGRGGAAARGLPRQPVARTQAGAGAQR